MVFNNNLLLGAAGATGGYTIDQSIRFNDNDSAHMNRIFGAGGTPKTFTTGCWFKVASFGDVRGIINSEDNSGSALDDFIIRLSAADKLEVIYKNTSNTQRIYWTSDFVLRDPAAWYFVAVTCDTTPATPIFKVFCNASGTSNWDCDSVMTKTSDSLAQNDESSFLRNSNEAHIGAFYNAGAGNYFDGYMAEIFIQDGVVITDPFTDGYVEIDENGVYKPLNLLGKTFGTQGGLYLGSDSSDLGADDSGNGNDFTSSGLAAADQMLDTPTNNFCTLNPVEPNWGGAVTLSDGNLALAGASSTVWNNAVATFKTLPSTGKWIWASEPNTSGAGRGDPWIVNETGLASRNNYVYVDANGWEAAFDSSSVHSVLNNGSGTNASFTYGSGDFHVICFDADSKKLWFGVYDVSTSTLQFRDGSTGFTGDPGAGTNPTFTLTGNEFSIGFATYTGRSGVVDFGQSDLLSQITIPTDFKTLCTANLPDPTIALPEKYFNTVLYEGNGGGQRVGGFQPITETYTVPNSVIFNDDDSASLTRTPGSAGDRRTFTFSCWVKRANLTGANQPIFSAGGDDWLMFLSAETLGFNTSASNYRIVTNQVFKDTSSWFHVVLRVDTTNATAGDRLRLYINGSEITDFGTDTNPTLNFETAFNNTGEHRIGKLVGASQYFDGYLAEINHIDGQSLGPDSFGQLDASTNRWIPKDTSGLTFGTNGFYLDFESGKESTSGATTTNMNATQFVNGSMGSWGTGDTAYDFTGGTTDSNINTGLSFIPSSTDFDFYGTLSAAASPNAPFLGWYNSGTNTNAGTPSTTASAGVYGRNGNSTGSSSGWLLLSGTREAARTNKSWEFQRKVGVHRRGSQLYGSIDGRIDYKYSSTPSTTSAGGLFLGNSGDGTSYTWSNVHSITYSSTTQNQYGLDSSGNGNNFTEEGTWDFLGGGNLSYDTPTRNSLGFWDGEFETGGTETVPSFGNTKINTTTGNDVGTPSRGFVSSGKWYYEIDVLAVYNGTGNSTYGAYGVVDYDSYGDTYDLSASGGLAYGGKVVAWQSNGTKLDESSATASVFNTVSAGDVIQIALDMDNGAVWFGKNNTWELSATASEIENGDTSNAVRTGLTGEWAPVFHRWTTTEHVEINAGSAFRFSDSELSLDTASGGYFKYTPPNGFKSLHNDNLPLSNGDLSAFVWIKNRDAADNHMLFDAVRGVTKDVHSNTTDLEATNANTLTSFLKNGFEVSNDVQVNTSGESYVAWQWLNDSLTTSTNNDGDITSTVLANTTSGFSIVTATPSLTGTENIGHGLGVAPKMILGKNLDLADNWYVYHDEISPSQSISLNTTGAATTTRYNAATTSSVFQIVNGAWTNGGQRCLWYCFAEVEGFSKFGRYKGNGSTNGPFIYTGFTPEFILIKSSSNSGTNWDMLDATREPFNDRGNQFEANTSDAEANNDHNCDFLSNGFKWRDASGSNNGSGYTIIYMAFARSPFKTSLAQ